MSKLSEYSKFDQLKDEDYDGDDDGGDDDDEDEEESKASLPPPKAIGPPGGITRKQANGRYVFEYNGQKIYEWEQTLEDVTMYVDLPPAAKLDTAPDGFPEVVICNIRPKRLQLGLDGYDRFFLDEATFGKVKAKESSWYISDGVIHIVMVKVFRGERWDCPLMGAGSADPDPIIQEEMKKELLLERFQEENPGMDFRDAKFNGAVPDAQTFMGGVRYGPS